MMAIIVGDIHGCVEKVRAFLAYKPEEQHIALGDYLDSFHESQERQLEALQLLLESDSILLWGNHDFNYHRTPPCFSTGYQFGLEEPYQQLIENHQDRFKAAYAVDGWLLTHAGVAQWLAMDVTDVYVLADMLNERLAEWLANPCETIEGIFAIGKARGGSGKYNSGGIFWFDFKREGDRLAKIKQIFGHTETIKPVVTDSYVALDTTNDKQFCWLFDTSINELVQLRIAHTMHEEIIDGMRYKAVGNRKPQDNRVRRISDLPEEEQSSFFEYLTCKTVPFIGGFWPADYRRWKAGDGMIKTDSQGRTWDTDEVKLDSIEFALEYPKYAGFTPTREDVEFLHLHRPERELEIRVKNTPRLRDLPLEEQEPFLEWMMGQTRPCIEGVAREDQDFFYIHDYRRWKAGLQHFDHDLSKVYRKELLDLRREVKSLLGRPERENGWFAEYNFHPDDLYNMNENELYDKIEVFKGLVKRLQNSETVEKDEHAGTV